MSALPAAFRVRKVRFASNSPNIGSESKSLIQSIRSIPGHRWEFTLQSVRLNEADSRKCFSWQVRQSGRKNVFDVVLPKYSKPKGVASGSPKVRTAAAAGSTQVQLKGFAGLVVGQLLDGDFIRFSNHSKVYMVAADVSSNVSGQLTIEIFPQLTKAVPLDTALIVRDVPFSMRQVRDIQEFELSTSDSGFVTLELDCLEAL